jgi:hypothetical protein
MIDLAWGSAPIYLPPKPAGRPRADAHETDPVVGMIAVRLGGQFARRDRGQELHRPASASAESSGTSREAIQVVGHVEQLAATVFVAIWV